MTDELDESQVLEAVGAPDEAMAKQLRARTWSEVRLVLAFVAVLALVAVVLVSLLNA